MKLNKRLKFLTIFFFTTLFLFSYPSVKSSFAACTVDGGGNITNSCSGSNGAAGTSGGDGFDMTNSSSVLNILNVTIQGGTGGVGSAGVGFFSVGGAGGVGGVGINVVGNNNSITNSAGATIEGGVGGVGGFGDDGGVGGAGGVGGVGINLVGNNNSITNSGNIKGGVGGVGGAGANGDSDGGVGGVGGAGINLVGNNNSITNNGSITGGIGGDGGRRLNFGGSGDGGVGGAGINVVGNNNSITNSAGATIDGGVGGVGGPPNFFGGGAGANGANGAGIKVNTGGSALIINNLGTIRGGGTSFGIVNSGTITTLNNAQGAGNSAGALKYSGTLPANYNAIITSHAIYGKLVASNLGVSTTVFGISSLSAGAVVVSGTSYTSVLSGITNTALGTSGTSLLNQSSNGYTFNLIETGIGTNLWDLTILSFTPSPSIADTMSSLTDQSNKLRQVFNNQTNIANNSLNYDCELLSNNNMCVAIGGRYSKYDFNGQHNAADVLVLGFKVNPNFRVSAHMDQKLNRSNLTGISLDNKTPLFGLLAVYNENPNGLGLQVKVANSYQDQDITATRTVFSTSEAGSGKTNLKTQNYLAELSYNIKTDDNLISSPYAGVRNSKIKQGGYTESTTTAVTDPLTYNALKDESNTLLIGIREKYKVDNNVSVFGSVGVEKDFNHSVDNYSASDVNNSGITAINFNNDVKKTRGTGTVGANYNFTPTSMISASFNYTQLPYQTTDAKNVYINYSVGF
jgi:hypothetical protein